MRTITVQGAPVLPEFNPLDGGEMDRRSAYRVRNRARAHNLPITDEEADRVKKARARRARAQQNRNEDRQAKRREQRLKQRQTLERQHCTIVEPMYKGKVGVAFASGPDLTAAVVEQIRPYVEDGSVIPCGLNDCYRIVPYLQQFYACDEHWWKYHLHNPQPLMRLPESPEPPLRTVHVLDDQPDCMIWGNNTAVKTTSKYDRISTIAGNGTRGFSTDPALIHWGGNSGYQLLNLMYHMGFEQILLVGYNMCVPDKLGMKGHHFFGPHPKPMSQSGSYKGFAKQFTTIQGDIRKKIINCTPRSALTAFEFGDLGEHLELARLERQDSSGTGDRTQPDPVPDRRDSSRTVAAGQSSTGIRGQLDVSGDEA